MLHHLTRFTERLIRLITFQASVPTQTLKLTGQHLTGSPRSGFGTSQRGGLGDRLGHQRRPYRYAALPSPKPRIELLENAGILQIVEHRQLFHVADGSDGCKLHRSAGRWQPMAADGAGAGGGDSSTLLGMRCTVQHGEKQSGSQLHKETQQLSATL